MTVRVRHADGSPAQGNEIVFYDGSRVVASAFSDASGSASFARPASAVDVFVLGASWEPRREALEPDASEVEVTLPGGAELTGRIRIDGGAPERPVVVGFLASMTAIDGAGYPGDLPDAVLLHCLRRRPSLCSLLTGDEGEFRFCGLPESWRDGYLVLPPYLTTHEGKECLPVAPLPEGGVLDCRYLPAATGRALGIQGEPLREADVQVRVSAITSMGERIVRLSGTTDGSGYFRVPFRSQIIDVGSGRGRTHDLLQDDAAGHAERIEVSLGDPRTSSATILTRDDVDVTGKVDLGDVVLQPVSEVRFRVLDPEGRPIPGAVAQPEEDYLQASEPTDEGGYGVLRGVPRTATVAWVSAWGHDRVSMGLPEERSATTRIELPPAAVLRVHCAEELLAPGLRVRFSGNPLFPRSQVQRIPPGTYRGRLTALRSSFEDGGSFEELEFEPERDTPIELSGLRVGGAVRIQVFRGDARIGEERTVVLQRGERRSIELEP